MRQRTSQVLFAYWNELRRARVAPRRFEVEPSRIAHILPETFILERSAPSTYAFRLAGTRICEQFGAELRGRNFLDLGGSPDRSLLERQLATVATHGAVGIFEIEAEAADGRVVEFEALVLPLLHPRNEITRFLGSLTAVDPPVWVGTEALTARGLVFHELLWPDGRPHAVIERSNRQAPFLPSKAGARIVRFDRRQFRVFDGGLKHGPSGDGAE